MIGIMTWKKKTLNFLFSVLFAVFLKNCKII